MIDVASEDTEEQRGNREGANENRERSRRPEAAEAAKQERTGKEPAESGKGQGGKAMDHGSIEEEQGRSRAER